MGLLGTRLATIEVGPRACPSFELTVWTRWLLLAAEEPQRWALGQIGRVLRPVAVGVVEEQQTTV